MLLIPCPHCGPRDEAEFTYGGAAVAPPPLDAGLAEWSAAIHHRANPQGPQAELWHHSAGCERWLRVARDTVTHAISAAEDAGAGP